jgi:hypothetical protein
MERDKAYVRFRLALLMVESVLFLHSNPAIS